MSDRYKPGTPTDGPIEVFADRALVLWSGNDLYLHCSETRKLKYLLDSRDHDKEQSENIYHWVQGTVLNIRQQKHTITNVKVLTLAVADEMTLSAGNAYLYLRLN